MKAESKRFYQSLMALVLPITLQNFITNAVNSADVFMLGYVGQTELSAVSLANQFQFLLSGVFFGISSAVVMLASQYWGKKDTDSIQAVMGIAVKIAFVITGLLAIGSVCMPEALMRIYTDNEIEAAFQTVKEYFSKEFDGCILTKLYYPGDTFAGEFSEWAAQYEADEAIVIYSSFDVDSSGGDGSLEPNSTYEDWKWVLVRSADEKWEHATHGYG